MENENLVTTSPYPRRVSRLMLSVCFSFLHYVLSFSVFFVMASYASDIEGLNTPLTGLKEKILLTAFHILLFPFGYLPFGILFNSAILGICLYFFLNWRAKSRLNRLY